MLEFSVANSRHVTLKNIENASGIGIQNARKRLELIYGENFTLDIAEAEKTFTVKLSIPL